MFKYSVIVVGLAALVVFGCGGAGDTSRLDSMYKGRWSGNWTSSDKNDNGPIAFTVTSDGSLSGSISGPSSGSGTIGGQIDKYGKFTGVASFPTGGNWMISGQTVLNNARLSSNFAFVVNGIQYGGAFDAGFAGGGTGTGTGTGGG